MKRKRREELSVYFEAPGPERKQSFVRQFGLQKMNLFYVAFLQARYISKGVWIFSALFFGSACLAAQITEPRYVSMVLGAVPFLVMISITESMRSYRYGMEELELSARFSLKSIVLARMMILGLGNFVVLTGVMLLLRSSMQINMISVMTPYFLTAGGSLFIVRHLPGTESTFPCMALAVVVGGLELYLPWHFGDIFQPEYVWVWVCICVFGVIATVCESYRMIQMTENLL